MSGSPAMGLDYGPVFQGLESVWRRDDEVFAEVSLPEGEHARSASFAVHPALLDAALHAALIANAENADGGGVRLPFSWGGVRFGVEGSSSLRVCITGVFGEEEGGEVVVCRWLVLMVLVVWWCLLVRW